MNPATVRAEHAPDGAPRIRVAVEGRDLLGECPLWDERRQALFWIDAHAMLIHAWWPADDRRQRWQAASMIGAIALTMRGRLLVALRDELALLDLEHGTGLWTRVARITHPAHDMRLNDGRCDRAGRFIFGSMALGRREPVGQLMQLDAAAGVRVIASGICVSNTVCFSPDGRTLYHADTPSRRILRRRYDPATGEAGEATLFADTQPLDGSPDGATVDAQGRLWVALVQRARLACFAPDGALVRQIDLPVPYPSCPAIGAAALDTLYVTSIRDSGNLLRSDHPDAGALLCIDNTGVCGLPEARFDDRLLA